MPSVTKRQLAEILEQIVPDVARRQIATGPHSVQCLGIEISIGAMSASRVELTDPKRSAREKPPLENLARQLRSQAATTVNNREHEFKLDIRSLTAARLPDVAPVRYFFAQSASIPLEVPDGNDEFSLQAWAFTSQQPSTPFSPLALRVAVARLTGAVRAQFSPPSTAIFASAVQDGALHDGLGVLAKLYPVDALATWQFDETTRMFNSLATFGMDVPELNLPVRADDDGQRRGIVSQLSPDGPLVVYDTQDRSLWRPAADDKWEPFDTELFRNHGWRSCIALPVSSGGRLVGALSAYSRRPATVFDACARDLTHASRLTTEAILIQREDRVLTNLAERYDEELLAANVSLSALSLSHDVLHYYRGVNQRVQNVKGYIETRQTQMALDTLSEIEATASRTEPAISAMRRLATEARRSRSKADVQLVSAPAELLLELERLLQAILPSFSKGRRLTADHVELTIEGTPRPIEISVMSLERIVVNLCVNSAQWKARDIWIAAHFDRSPTEVQIVVRDNGRGIPASHRDQVFDRFYSGRRGSGLGLYVVKSLASRAGGEAYVQSYDYSAAEAQRGTIVTVVLPTQSIG